MGDVKNSCGCSFDTSNLIKDDIMRKDIVEKVKIDRKKFLNGDIIEITKFAYAVNPDEFNLKINDLGLKITNIESDAEFLVKLNEKGLDKKGTLKDKAGNPINFNFMELLKSIKLNRKVIDRTKFNFV